MSVTLVPNLLVLLLQTLFVLLFILLLRSAAALRGRGGRATRRGREVTLNSLPKASQMMLQSVFSRTDSTELENSGNLQMERESG